MASIILADQDLTEPNFGFYDLISK